MRSEWTGSIAVALVAVGCSSPKFDPLLPMNEAGPKFIAANCPVPVKVHRRTVGEGDAARVLVDHDCLYDRDGDALSLTMTMTFDEATKQVVELQVMAGAPGGARDTVPGDTACDYGAMRDQYRAAGGTGAWMVNNGYDAAIAQQSLSHGADLVAFGRPFIANPDLPRRLREHSPLNTVDRATLYGGGAAGYTDYPALALA